MGGNGGICRIVLLRSPITASGRPDVWGAALGNIRRAYKRIAGHRGKYVGIFRRRLDGISQRLRKVNTSRRRAQTGVSEGLEPAAVGTLVQPLTKAQYLSTTTAKPESLFSHIDQQHQWQASISNTSS